MLQLSPSRRPNWSVCHYISQTICKAQSLSQIPLNKKSPPIPATNLSLWIRHQIRFHQGSEFINYPGKVTFHHWSSSGCHDWLVLGACVKINMACMFLHPSHVRDQWTEVLRLLSAFHCAPDCKLLECICGNTTLSKLCSLICSCVIFWPCPSHSHNPNNWWLSQHLALCSLGVHKFPMYSGALNYVHTPLIVETRMALSQDRDSNINLVDLWNSSVGYGITILWIG